MLENIAEDWSLDPLPFAYKLMTRSGRITHEKLKKRDPEFALAYEEWLRLNGEIPQSAIHNPQSNVAS